MLTGTQATLPRTRSFSPPDSWQQNVTRSMAVMYGANSIPYEGHPELSAIQTLNLLSPGALARQQRASADTKRGKRRRPLSDGAAQATAESGEGSARDNTSSVVQVVPSKAGVPPVVKVKEERRKKRLLRNRVSAQQARERKRHHINDLEENCNTIEKKNQQLEERMNTLMKENEELRQIVKGNMRASGGSNNTGGPTTPTDYSRTMGSEVSRPRAEVPRPVDMYGYNMVSPMTHPQRMSYGGHEQGMYMQNNGGHIHS